MKNRIRRTKQFVTKHSHKIVATTGFVAGVAITYHHLSSDNGVEHLLLTVDQAQKLIDNPNELCMKYDLPRQAIHVFVDATKP